MAAQRWWVTLEDDYYGYLYSEEKPKMFDWVTIWTVIPPATRPVKHYGKIMRVWDGN